MISVRTLTTSYRNGVSRSVVLRRIDLEVEEGEFLTIQAPSGAGKTTLLHILDLLDEPTGNLQSRQSEQIIERMRQLNREEGVTIVQVPHSEKQARYGDRIVDDYPVQAETAAESAVDG